MRILAGALLTLATACASSNAPVPRPVIEMFQLRGPSDLAYTRGQNTMDAYFGFRIRNEAQEPITLRRIDLQSMGDGGYYLRREDQAFNNAIPAGATAEATMRARAAYSVTSSGTASREPVTVRAVVYFETPKGSFQQIVMRNIEQFTTGPK